MSLFLEAQGVVKSYNPAEGAVLNGIDLSLSRGDRVAIVGASGAGKSTLLHILGALDPPTSGTVRFLEKDLYAQSDTEISRIRNQAIGFVFQFPYLLPEFSVLENVMMPLLVRGAGRRLASKRAEEVLVRVGLTNLARRRPAELSGGEQQRIALARAIVGEPEILLADEPTGNLDRANGEKVFDLLLEVSDGKGLIVVTHNEALAARIPRRFRLADGRLHPLS